MEKTVMEEVNILKSLDHVSVMYLSTAGLDWCPVFVQINNTILCTQ